MGHHLLQAFRDSGAQSLRGEAGGLNLPDEGNRDPAVWTDHELAGIARFAPHVDRNDVFRADHISFRIDGQAGRGFALGGLNRRGGLSRGSRSRGSRSCGSLPGYQSAMRSEGKQPGDKNDGTHAYYQFTANVSTTNSLLRV